MTCHIPLRRYVKLGNFAMARRANPVSGLVVALSGSIGYMSPERCGCAEDPAQFPHGAPVDWFSLGVILHEMLFGKSPFGTEGQDCLERFGRLPQTGSESRQSVDESACQKLPEAVGDEVRRRLSDPVLSRPPVRSGGQVNSDDKEVKTDRVVDLSVPSPGTTRRQLSVEPMGETTPRSPRLDTAAEAVPSNPLASQSPETVAQLRAEILAMIALSSPVHDDPSQSVSNAARQLATALMNPNVEERLGTAKLWTSGSVQVCAHPFFNGVNWEALLESKVDSPYKLSHRQLARASSIENDVARPQRRGSAGGRRKAADLGVPAQLVTGDLVKAPEVFEVGSSAVDKPESLISIAKAGNLSEFRDEAMNRLRGGAKEAPMEMNKKFPKLREMSGSVQRVFDEYLLNVELAPAVVKKDLERSKIIKQLEATPTPPRDADVVQQLSMLEKTYDAIRRTSIGESMGL